MLCYLGPGCGANFAYQIDEAIKSEDQCNSRGDLTSSFFVSDACFDSRDISSIDLDTYRVGTDIRMILDEHPSLQKDPTRDRRWRIVSNKSGDMMIVHGFIDLTN